MPNWRRIAPSRRSRLRRRCRCSRSSSSGRRRRQQRWGAPPPQEGGARRRQQQRLGGAAAATNSGAPNRRWPAAAGGRAAGPRPRHDAAGVDDGAGPSRFSFPRPAPRVGYMSRVVLPPSRSKHGRFVHNSVPHLRAPGDPVTINCYGHSCTSGRSPGSDIVALVEYCYGSLLLLWPLCDFLVSYWSLDNRVDKEGGNKLIAIATHGF